MKKFFVFFLLYSLNIYNIIVKSEDGKLILRDVTDGVYNIIIRKRYACLTYIGGIRSSREKYGNTRLNFRFTEVKSEEVNQKDEKQNVNLKNNNKNKKFFRIRHLYTRNLIGVKVDKNNLYTLIGIDQLIKSPIFSFDWEFIKIYENVYIIQNKAGCYLKEEKSSFVCTLSPKPRTEYHLLKLFTEVSHTKEDLSILEKEPIDVFIKYIDLSDKNLVREGISQIKKDKDNEELRYSIRSILKNIPWVRKIFILMPNEKVRYFKDKEFISEKIIYVKDKDLIGFDSADSHAFQYRIWKMKEYGLSDNFIIMDDDYFIGKPLNKSDFFYVENNTVFPAIINTNYEVVTNSSATKELNNRKKKIIGNSRPQTSDRFMYSVYKAYLFLIEYFNIPLIVPYFTHNAIPANINDIKEVYDLIYNSVHRNATLFSLYRNNETLQFQTSLVVYTFNKYKRKTNLINYNYIDNAKTIYGKYNFPLFCINTGNNNDYSDISFIKTKLVMEYLFPEPTKYEIFNSSIVPNNAYNVLNILEKELNQLKKQKELDDIDKEKFENEKISKEYSICENKVDMIKSQSDAYTSIIKKRKNDIENCTKNNEYFKAKIDELNNSIKKEKIMEELNGVVINNKNNVKKLNEFKKEHELYLKEIQKLKNKDKIIYFFIYFQLILIILIVLFVGVFYPLKKKYNNNLDRNKSNNENNFIRISKQKNNDKLKLFDEIEMNLIK